MKKIILVLLSVFTFSILMNSCKTHDHCAAYSKVNKIKTEKDFLRTKGKAV